MSTARRTPPTRHALRSVEHRLDRVRTAADLLLRKRRALVSELFRMAGPALDAREEIASLVSAAAAALREAEAARGHALLAALALPGREVTVELHATETWGVPAAQIRDHTPLRRTARERAVAAGSAGPAVAAAAQGFETLTERVLDAASREVLIRRLADALEQTSRRVNLLERRVAPELDGEIRRIEGTLEEREREDQLRYRRLLERDDPAAPGASVRVSRGRPA